jgi:HAD superfamily hydrolase (TIGR01509 family)
MKIKAILFDHDGTLVDSEMAHFEMWRSILKTYSVELSHDEYLNEYSGIPSDVNARLIFENHSLEVSPNQLLRAKAEATTSYLSESAFPLMPGAYEVVSNFHDLGLKIGIVTGAGREGMETTIRKHKFDKYVSTAVSGDDVKTSKPAPDCYLLAAQNLGVHPSECLAIEDTVNGIAAATAAKIKCIGVSQSKVTREKFSNTAHICSDLYEASTWAANKFQL